MTDPTPGHPPGAGRGAKFAAILVGIVRLVQGEMALARVEMAQRLGLAKSALIWVVVAAAFGITALHAFATAGAAALVAIGLTAACASALVGLLFLGLTLALGWHAARLFQKVGTGSDRSADSIQQDVEILKKMVNPDENP